MRTPETAVSGRPLQQSARRKSRPPALVFHHFPPYPGAGSIRAVHFARAWAARLAPTDRLVLLTTVTDQKIASQEQSFDVVALSDDPVDNRRSLLSRALGELDLGLRAGFQLLRRRPRMVAISSPGYIFAMTTALCARALGLPYVLDIRDVYPEVYASAGVLKPGSIPYRMLEGLSRSMYRGARRVTAATEGLARIIREIRGGAAGVDVVYNGYPQALRNRTAVKFERFTCVFHGVLGYYQDAGSLLALARALEPHGVDVVVIGFGREETVFANSPPSNFRFLGRLPFEDTIAIVERAHVGLCLRNDDPISRDAFPVKVFEYIALRLPMLITPPCEAGDFVEAIGCGRVFAAGDIEAMMGEVIRLRDDAAYYSARVRACAEGGQEFARELQAARFAELVDAVDHDMAA